VVAAGGYVQELLREGNVKTGDIAYK
jgi:hypothetical protein